MGKMSPRRWAVGLRQIAAPWTSLHAELHAGELTGPFLAAVAGVPVKLPDQPVEWGEVGLWWARVDTRVNVDRIISGPTPGPLLPRGLYKTIEVWTDADLSAIHALWWLSRRYSRADWMQRVAEVRDWHVENTQPDHATSRPWALHVFLLAGTPECESYAETLLHNCLAMSGRPDALSAWILIDASRAIVTSR